MGISNSTNESRSYDYASGQNAAAQKSDELAQSQASHLQQMMTNPIAALSVGDRIRQLQAYLSAYRGGYQLPHQEVVPQARLASHSISESNSVSDT